MVQEFPQGPLLEIVIQYVLSPENKWEIPRFILSISFCPSTYSSHKARLPAYLPPVSAAT